MNNMTSMDEIVSEWNVDVGRISISTSETGQQLLLSGIVSRKIAFTKDVIYQLDIRAHAVGNTHTHTAHGGHRSWNAQSHRSSTRQKTRQQVYMRIVFVLKLYQS